MLQRMRGAIDPGPEIIGPGRPSGPIEGAPITVAHLDAARCQRTGNVEYPIIYHDINEQMYKLHYTRVIDVAQMTSPEAEMSVQEAEALCDQFIERRATRTAIERVLPVASLRYLGYSHVEADECGAMNDFLALAPAAVPLCSRVGAQVSMGDLADRPPRAMGDGEELDLGRHRIQWLDTPHVPHGWDAGLIWIATARTLLCGDLFTQPGAELPPVTERDILGPSEAMRGGLDYWAHAVNTRGVLERLARLAPRTLACMHGAAWRGDGSALLRALADRIEGSREHVAPLVALGS